MILIYINMPKKYTIFSIETYDSVIHMEVNKPLYKAYQILSPLEKNAMQDLTTLQLLKQNGAIRRFQDSGSVSGR